MSTNTNQTVTFYISGPNVTYAGKGDKHDLKYQDSKISFTTSVVDEIVELAMADNVVRFTFDMYPSEELENMYLSNRPIVYAAIVGATFLISSLAFLLYDYLVRNTQNQLTQLAVKSTRIVDSLFPATVRNRLYGIEEKIDKPAGNDGLRGPSELLRRFLSPSKSSAGNHSDNSSVVSSDYNPKDLLCSQPIADAYSSATVLFADLAGFTAWSSERPPDHVFLLLEALYGEFDKAAEVLGVFKVETIGDCYMAVCGESTCHCHVAVACESTCLEHVCV